MSKEATVRDLIAKWNMYRDSVPVPARFCTLKSDLYRVRNAGFGGNPPLAAWPAHLANPDDEIMASVEHYFLTRCWVGGGTYPEWEVRMLSGIYNAGKKLGVTPRHNPSKPVTPPSAMQKKFQNEGIVDGARDLSISGGKAPIVAKPPKYY